MQAGTSLQLTKHEGAGNDFLVLVDLAAEGVVTAALARALCDRHRGVGADGVIGAGEGRDGADLSMLLRNADGREAEMSGNGIRCLAQAAVLAGVVAPPRLTVATAAGVRTVEYAPGPRPDLASASVDMGEVTLGAQEAPPTPATKALRVEVGNPHLVLLVPDPGVIDVKVLGPKVEAAYPGGINVEFVGTGAAAGELVLRVWERGVGETLACGTGACAAAAAARSWGLTDDTVRVHNPGGVLEVRLGRKDGDPAVLAGPVRKVADVVVDPGALLGE
jgi:diaminopimelate epimerase